MKIENLLFTLKLDPLVFWDSMSAFYPKSKGSNHYFSVTLYNFIRIQHVVYKINFMVIARIQKGITFTTDLYGS